MNNQSNKYLQEVAEKLEEARKILDCVSAKEEAAFGNMPKSFQDGEKGEAMQSYMEAIDGVSGDIDGLESNINDIIEGNV